MSIFFEESDTTVAAFEPDPWPNLNDCRSCGLCLRSCPTYQLTALEAESPRGRIREIVKLLRDGEPLDAERWQHLNNCLQCRSCERVCPSKIPYHRHLHEALAQQPVTTSLYKNAGLALAAANNTVRGVIGRVLNIYRKSGVQLLTRILKLPTVLKLERAERLLLPDTNYQPLKPFYSATATQRGTVALFSGCASSVLDHTTLIDAIKVLNALGYGVHVPEQQRCCGTLHSHNQDHEQADALKQANIAAFAAVKADAIVYVASGCGAKVSRFDKENLPPVYEVCEFIIDHAWHDGITLQPLPERVALHTPCTMRFPISLEYKPQTLLGKIPQLTVIPLNSAISCCGAAGSYMFTHPDNSDKLADITLEAIIGSSARYLATTNIGCALHIGANAAEAAVKIEIVHPVSLIARQLSNCTNGPLPL